MMLKDGITILDSKMRVDEIRIIKNHAEILGFNIENRTGEHLFIEPEFNSNNKLVRIKVMK